jgi:ribosomal protein S6
MGAQVEYLDRWGERRRLAYEVKGRREGAYVIMNFKAEPAAAKELDRVLRISEDVYRHIIIYLEPDEVELSKAERDRTRVAPAPVEAPAEAAPAVEEAAEAPAAEAEAAAPEAEAAPAEEAPAAEATEEA